MRLNLYALGDFYLVSVVLLVAKRYYELEMKQDFIIYSADGQTPKVKVIIGDETVWLSQKQMASVFGCSVDSISLHLKNIYQEGELDENRTSEESSIVQMEGSRMVQRRVKIYNLDAIISVGYRVNSASATQFRIWATSTLREFIIKGFVMDDERLKQGGQHFGKDYFEELLERIREIRASEKIFYRKITDLFATSADYDSESDEAKQFFATIQNKLHWAIHRHTAAELIAERANSQSQNMGLTSWKTQKQNGKIRKSDITVAKNYLRESELKSLNRLVGMFLDFAENMAEKNTLMKMREWKEKLNSFLAFNEYEILNGVGKVSQAVAAALATQEYEKFKTQNLPEDDFSDFDKILQRAKDS